MTILLRREVFGPGFADLSYQNKNLLLQGFKELIHKNSSALVTNVKKVLAVKHLHVVSMAYYQTWGFYGLCDLLRCRVYIM